MASTTQLDDATLDELNERFEREPARAVIRWAVDTFHPRLCITASMTDAVLIDLAVQVEPSIEVVFIDTGYHFAETLHTVDVVRDRYDLNLRIMRQEPAPPEPLWKVDPVNCCSAMKVALLDEALRDKDAWMSGLRRDEAVTRAEASIVGRDRRGLVKVNPIATWSDHDVAGYIADHEIPFNPLLRQGYLSIGCAPCTRPAMDGDDPRSGRWVGSEKTECGLHL